MLVAVEAGAFVSLAAAGFDGGLIAKDDACASDSKLPEVHEVPVRRPAVDRAILAHG